MSKIVSRCVAIALAFGLAHGLPGLAQAQGTFPDRPVKLVVAFPPGGATDTFTRPLVDDLRVALGTSVVVENRGGGGGQVGWNAVAQSEPDGYTVLIAENALVISQALYRELGTKFDPRKHYHAIAGLGHAPLVFGVGAKVPVDNWNDFIKYARAQKQPLSYASAGVGTVSHLIYEVIREGAKFPALHIPYKGGGPAIADVVAGHVPTLVAAIGVGKLHADAGKIKPLAVTGPERSPTMPNVPTLRELGVKHADVDLSFWWGAYVPRGVPEPVRARLEKAFQQVATSPAARARMAKVDTTLEFLSAKELSAKTENEIVNWTKFIDAMGLRK